MAEPTERIAILLELEQQEFERRAKRAGAAIDRLERKYSPLAAAEAKMEKQQLRFNAALEAGTIDAAQHAKAMGLVQREYDQTVAKVKNAVTNVVAMNSSVRANSGFVNRNKEAFRQAGYQVGDFAVQVQGGTSWLTAFSQQGSQLLGIFGPWGAVMGGVLAVGSALAGVLLGLGDATEKTKEKAKTFADRLSEAEAALASMSAAAANVSDLEALRKKYGELTDEVREMALALLEIDRREALTKVTGIIAEVTGAIEKAAEASSGVVAAALSASGTDAGKATAEAYRAEIETIQNSIDQRRNAGIFVDPSELKLLEEMREELAAMEGNFSNLGSLAQEINVSPELLSQLSQAQAELEAARDAGDFSEMASQLGTIRDLLVEAGDTVSQDVVDGVTRAESLAREMAARLNEGKEAAEGIVELDLASGISPAVEEALKLVKGLDNALNLAKQIVANEAAAKVGRGRGADPRKFGGSAEDIQANVPGAQLAYQPGGTAGVPLPDKEPARGGSGGRDLEPLFSIADGEVQRLKRSIELLDKSKDEVVALTTKHKLLDEAKKRGLDITDELLEKIDAESANVGRLAGEYEQARDKVAQLERIQGAWKDSVIDAAMGGADAMDAFTNSIKRAALEYLLFGQGLFAGGGGSGSGSFSGLLGSVFDSLTGKRANGGSARAGGAYLVNENTPNSEIFVPSQSGGVLNVPQAQAALRGAGGGTQIVVNNYGREPVEENRRKLPDGRELIEMNVGKSIASGRLDKQLNGRVGVSPTQRKRG
jgi:hypothetical protein